ncbi:MAG TPA: 50S ribosomal protein L29 [Gemmatimonadales bacterium]|nr:50S ribosomal protein L29 [Gemmatimonadales bacterium]
MKPQELREMSVEDLESKVNELTEEKFRLRFRSATESIENPIRFRTIRRDIARIKTILKEKSGVGSQESGVSGSTS